MARLAKHGNITGMKDSSGDMSYFEKVIPAQSESFTVLTGNGGTWASALGLGASGGILAVALFAPELSLDVWRAHQEGRASYAAEFQRRLSPLAVEIVGRMGVAGVKEAMDRAAKMLDGRLGDRPEVEAAVRGHAHHHVAIEHVGDAVGQGVIDVPCHEHVAGAGVFLSRAIKICERGRAAVHGDDKASHTQAIKKMQARANVA